MTMIDDSFLQLPPLDVPTVKILVFVSITAEKAAYGHSWGAAEANRMESIDRKEPKASSSARRF